MSTNCLIARKSSQGVQSIRCFMDGYLQFTGKILLTKYSDFTKLKPLLDNGDIQCLGDETDKVDVNKQTLPLKFRHMWDKHNPTPLDWETIKPKLFRTDKEFWDYEYKIKIANRYTYIWDDTLSMWLVKYYNQDKYNPHKYEEVYDSLGEVLKRENII